MTMLLVLLTRFTHNIKCQAPESHYFRSEEGEIMIWRFAVGSLGFCHIAEYRQLRLTAIKLRVKQSKVRWIEVFQWKSR